MIKNNTIERRILIVDDDRDFVESLFDILEPRSYKLAAAYSAKEAVETIRDFSTQVALLDLKLPDGSGTALISGLKQVNRDSVCIMITAHADLDSAIAALEKGAAHYLQKPLRPEELLKLLEQVFETISLREEKRRAEEALQKAYNEMEEKVKERTRELEEKNRELERFNKLFVDREFRIKELRERVKELEKRN